MVRRAGAAIRLDVRGDAGVGATFYVTPGDPSWQRTQPEAAIALWRLFLRFVVGVYDRRSLPRKRSEFTTVLVAQAKAASTSFTLMGSCTAIATSSCLTPKASAWARAQNSRCACRNPIIIIMRIISSIMPCLGWARMASPPTSAITAACLGWSDIQWTDLRVDGQVLELGLNVWGVSAVRPMQTHGVCFSNG